MDFHLGLTNEAMKEAEWEGHKGHGVFHRGGKAVKYEFGHKSDNWLRVEIQKENIDGLKEGVEQFYDAEKNETMKNAILNNKGGLLDFVGHLVTMAAEKDPQFLNRLKKEWKGKTANVAQYLNYDSLLKSYLLVFWHDKSESTFTSRLEGYVPWAYTNYCEHDAPMSLGLNEILELDKRSRAKTS